MPELTFIAGRIAAVISGGRQSVSEGGFGELLARAAGLVLGGRVFVILGEFWDLMGLGSCVCERGDDEADFKIFCFLAARSFASLIFTDFSIASRRSMTLSCGTFLMPSSDARTCINVSTCRMLSRDTSVF